MTDDFLSRSAALLGAEKLARLKAKRLAIVGVGGVGSWCAEALVRTGARHLTLVDDDTVAPSNVNRQAEATRATLGERKVDALAARLKLLADDDLVVAARAERLTAATAGPLLAESDIVVDAIDSVDCKAALLCAATAADVPVVSAMGAALRTDPTRVTVMRFDRVTGDGLARALRQRFKRTGVYPTRPFWCVVSTEAPAKSGIRGSIMPVTATFGLVLAAEVLRLCD